MYNKKIQRIKNVSIIFAILAIVLAFIGFSNIALTCIVIAYAVDLLTSLPWKKKSTNMNKLMD